MSIYKYQKYWKAEVYANGNRITSKSGFRTKKLAQVWHDDFVSHYRSSSESIKLEKSKPKTFTDLIEAFREIHLPTVRPSTRIRYEIDLRDRIGKFFQYMELDNINSVLIEKFRSQIMKNLSVKTVNDCMMILKLLFNKAIEWGFLDKSPFKLKALKKTEYIYKWWDDKTDIQKFLDAIRNNPYEGAYRLALECGMRAGEIVGLSKQDINFDRGQIHVHRQWLDVQRCYGPTKHNKSRTINFDPESDLGRVLSKAVSKSKDNEVIFVTSTGNRVSSRNLANPRYKTAIKKAGVPYIRFHDLRHTFASWYMIEVSDIWSLMAILGHSNIATTMRYAHLSTQHQKTHCFSWATANNLKNRTHLKALV